MSQRPNLLIILVCMLLGLLSSQCACRKPKTNQPRTTQVTPASTPPSDPTPPSLPPDIPPSDITDEMIEAARAIDPWLETLLRQLKTGETTHINDPNPAGDTALHLAVDSSNKDIVDVLIKHGADIHVVNQAGMTPFYKAIKNDSQDIIDLLLKQGANINALDKNGNTPLYKAIKDNDPDMIDRLLKHGANINAKDPNNKTPLHIAAKEGNKAMVDLLLNKGAGLSNISGMDSPEKTAILHGHLDIAHILIGKRLLDYADARAGTLYAACIKGELDTVKGFIHQGIDINQPDPDPFHRDGHTALGLAAVRRHQAIVELLLDNGADINLPDKNGHTALYMTAVAGTKSMAELLIQRGAQLNIRNKAGVTPLHIAAYNGYKDIVELLVENGDDINIKDNNGYPPLFKALYYGHKDIVDLLIQKGAKMDPVNINGEGYTPLEYVRVLRDGALINKNKRLQGRYQAIIDLIRNIP